MEVDIMTQFETLDRLVKDGNGYLYVPVATKAGISRTVLGRYVKERKMERVGHGLYLSQDAWEDFVYQIALTHKGIIFSHETALYLHGLMEREPSRECITVPTGHNASHLAKKGLEVHHIKAELAGKGATVLKTPFGNPVPVYDAERTICDIIRNKKNMDIQVFVYAIKEYMRRKEKDVFKLMSYAKEFRMESAVRTYTEVLL